MRTRPPSAVVIVRRDRGAAVLALALPPLFFFFEGLGSLFVVVVVAATVWKSPFAAGLASAAGTALVIMPGETSDTKKMLNEIFFSVLPARVSDQSKGSLFTTEP
jgi:hypothetical protein